MNVFKVDFDRLILLLLPTFLRKSLLRAFLTAAVKPLITIRAQFERYQRDVEILAKYDTGKRNVEIALKKKFGNGIYIQNIAEADFTENVKPAYLTQYTDFYIDETQPSPLFAIFVPSVIFNSYEKEIYDFTGYFTLPGILFKVVKY